MKLIEDIKDVASSLMEINSFDDFLSWFEGLPSSMQILLPLGVIGLLAISIAAIITFFLDRDV